MPLHIHAFNELSSRTHCVLKQQPRLPGFSRFAFAGCDFSFFLIQKGISLTAWHNWLLYFAERRDSSETEDNLRSLFDCPFYLSRSLAYMHNRLGPTSFYRGTKLQKFSEAQKQQNGDGAAIGDRRVLQSWSRLLHVYGTDGMSNDDHQITPNWQTRLEMAASIPSTGFDSHLRVQLSVCTSFPVLSTVHHCQVWPNSS